jgi:hypothetical protein
MLYAHAGEVAGAGVIEFLDRMSWLPPLLAELGSCSTGDHSKA